MNRMDRTTFSKQCLCRLAVAACVISSLLPIARAQDTLTQLTPKPMTAMQRHDAMEAAPTQTFYLKNSIMPADINEIAAMLRQLMPDEKTFVLPSQHAIVIKALPDDMALATRLIGDMDRPHDTFRLTYTVTEFDGARKLSSQRYSTSIADGQQMTIKQGSKVPITTGKIQGDTPQTQFAYQDVGMTFDSSPVAVAGGINLRFDVIQSSVPAPPQPGQDPVFQQTELRDATVVPLGKPTPLGSLDISGTTRHLEIEVLVEKLP